MTNRDDRIDHYYALHPVDFSVLVSLCLEQRFPSQNEPAHQLLQLELRPIDEADPRRLVLSFSGVQQLRLTPIPSSVMSLSPFDILSIRDRQWEEVNYEVREIEQEDQLSFLCRDFDAGVYEAIDR